MLAKNDTLSELYLHWNQITGFGGVPFFKGLKKNVTLKVLDFSWNVLGSYENSNVTKYIGKVLKNSSKTLIHVDLSYNNFSLEESKKIEDYFIVDANIMGMHF